MADKIRIGYFLEDRGHEIFLKALVAKIAQSKGLARGDWIDDVRASTGGKSIQAYKNFLRDLSRTGAGLPFDILIVASDGNCKGYGEKKRQLKTYAEKKHQIPLDKLIFAIPDPHIERWYLLDTEAFKRAIGTKVTPFVPDYKCKKALYKNAIRKAFSSSLITPFFNGYEYGEKIVNEMDIFRAARADNGLKHFIDDLKRILSLYKHGSSD